MPALALLSFFVLALFLYARYIEPRILRVKRVRIDTGQSLGDGQGLRIALLSDFHYPRYSSFPLVRKAIALSGDFNPDIVLVLGDLFDKNRTDPTVLPQNIGEVFGQITSRSGVFGVLGNHDHWFDAKAIRASLTAETEIRLIDNQAVPITVAEQTIYLVGVGDLWSKDVDYEKAVKAVPQDAAIILLSHNPDVIEEISDSRILIQFSGHTHGGQIRFPFVGALKVPSKFGNTYCRGLIKTGKHPLYVNSGICSMKNMRFLCPPEVTWIEFH